MRQFKEIEGAFDKALGPGERRQRETRRHQSWRTPELGWVKINTDRCHKHTTGRTSCGGVMRDNKANFLGAFTCYIGICGVFEAEIWGIYQGLMTTWDMGYCRVILEMDNATTVRSINGSGRTS